MATDASLQNWLEMLPGLSQLQYRVLKAVKKHQPVTFRELAREMDDLSDRTVQPRLSELADKGLVDDSTSRPCRRSNHDRPCTAYQITDKGREVVFDGL